MNYISINRGKEKGRGKGGEETRIGGGGGGGGGWIKPTHIYYQKWIFNKLFLYGNTKVYCYNLSSYS